MSNPFTNPYSAPTGQTWQTMLDEITLAYSERRQVVYLSAYTPTDAKDVQDVTYWTTLQNWLEDYYNYIDYISGPIQPAGTQFLYFTLATWRSAAGLNASGFRRATEWNGIAEPTWSYGIMQAGDIIGPWIFEDLQKGFSALRWTGYAGLVTTTQYFGDDGWHITSASMSEDYMNILSNGLDISAYYSQGDAHFLTLFQEWTKGGTTSWAGDFWTEQLLGSFIPPVALLKWNFTNQNS